MVVALAVFVLWAAIVVLEALFIGVEGQGPRALWWALASLVATVAFLAWRYHRLREVLSIESIPGGRARERARPRASEEEE